MRHILVVILLSLSAALTAADDLIPLRIAFLEKVHYAQIMVATEDRLWERAGLAVTEVVVGPGSGILSAEALMTGAADAAAMGDSPMIISCSREPLPLLLCAYISAERQHRLVAQPGVTISAPTDLRGKRVAVMHGSSTHAGLLLLLERHGIALNELTLVNLNPKDMAAALQTSQVDVAIASDPVPDLMLARVQGSSPAGDLSGLGTDYPYGVLVSRRWAERHPEGPARLHRVLVEATGIINNDRERVVALIARRTGDGAEDVRRWMELCGWEIGGGEALLQRLAPLAAAMQASGSLRQAPRLAEALWQGAP